MKKIVLAAALMLGMTHVYADAWTGNVNAFLGQKSLESDDWAPLDDQGEFGILIDFKQPDWPVSIAIDLLGSRDEATILGVNVEASTTELDLGVRQIFEVGGSSFKPFIGAGLALVSGKIEGSLGNITATVDDNTLGVWADAGVYWTLGESFNIGAEVRYSKAEITLMGYDIEAGGTHAGLLLGYHW